MANSKGSRRRMPVRPTRVYITRDGRELTEREWEMEVLRATRWTGAPHTLVPDWLRVVGTEVGSLPPDGAALDRLDPCRCEFCGREYGEWVDHHGVDRRACSRCLARVGGDPSRLC